MDNAKKTDRSRHFTWHEGDLEYLGNINDQKDLKEEKKDKPDQDKNNKNKQK